MKTYNVITLFPEMIEALTSGGVLGQAQKAGILRVKTLNPRVFTSDMHKTVDDRPFGGGDGMLMLAEPLAQAVESLAPDIGQVIYLSPKGAVFTDKMAQQLAEQTHLTFICGRYGGLDQRFINQYVDQEISIGDYVLSGGELAAGVVIDALARFVPGVLGHEQSAQVDSITCGHLEAPAYTRPREWRGQLAPEILLTGHHQKMEEWKWSVGLLLTWQRRPDLGAPQGLKRKQIENLRKFATSLLPADLEQLGLDSFDPQKFEDWLLQQL